jgi:hypothetical protein
LFRKFALVDSRAEYLRGGTKRGVVHAGVERNEPRILGADGGQQRERLLRVHDRPAVDLVR